MAPKVAIITVTFNSEPDLPGYFESLRRIQYPSDSLSLVIYDNASKDASAAYAEGVIKTLPFRAECVAASENTGFTGGNNRAYKKLSDVDYVFLLNPDTAIEPDCIEIMVQAFEEDSTIGAGQPLILTLPDTSKINTTGNLCHYLGFGMVRDNGKDRMSVQSETPREIVSVSGAGFFLRKNVLGPGEPLFEEGFFAYHEDFELSWRMRLKGFRLCMFPRAVMYHRYSFGKGTFKFYLLERNRAHVLLTHYSVRTLILLSPFIVFTEFVVFAQSMTGGWAGGKIRAWRDTVRNRKEIAARRRVVQSMRTVPDRTLFRNMHDILIFPETTPFLVSVVYNPISKAYKKLCSRFV